MVRGYAPYEWICINLFHRNVFRKPDENESLPLITDTLRHLESFKSDIWHSGCWQGLVAVPMTCIGGSDWLMSLLLAKKTKPIDMPNVRLAITLSVNFKFDFNNPLYMLLFIYNQHFLSFWSDVDWFTICNHL